MKRRSKIILAIVFASVILLSSVGLLVFHLLTNPKVEARPTLSGNQSAVVSKRISLVTSRTAAFRPLRLKTRSLR